MNTTKILGIAAVVLILGAGWYALSFQSASDDALMQKDESAMGTQGGDVMMSSGSYEPYSPEKLALAETEDILLFFHAPWCPICRGIESEIIEDPSVVPVGVRILKVNYDTEVALKQKYGVTYQHTFVQVDSAGNAIQKFSDAYEFSDVLARVK